MKIITTIAGLLTLSLLNFGTALYAQMVIKNSSNSNVIFINQNGKMAMGKINVTTPLEALDVGGALRLGTTASANTGTIRWNDSHFQGRNSNGWVNLDIGDSQTLSINGYQLSISSGNTVTLPYSAELYNNGTPRSILIVFSGGDIGTVYYKDGIPDGITDPPHNGWNSTLDYTRKTFIDGGGHHCVGILIPPSLSDISDDEKALNVRCGGFGPSGGTGAGYLGYHENPSLKQMGSGLVNGSLECNGTLFLNTARQFCLMSQRQGDSDPNGRLTHLWVTIFGGFK